ncbi:MAG: serine hydrolase [Candidatus Latescibacteria bacterium]|nr:serine hydrolase [Candidatus Latescibacterota bacterium]
MNIKSQIDPLFAAWDRTDAPGLALAVVRDGYVVHRRGYGLANLEYQVPITPTTLFNVGSITKQFTAAAMALLACEGKLSLDDDIRTHLPYLPDYGRPLTYRQIMNHTSGLRSSTDVLFLAGWRKEDLMTQGDILALARRQQDLNFAPGSEWEYSNTGYYLLAEAVQAVTGLSLGEFLQQRFFTPLGMADSLIFDDHTRSVPNRAYAYRTRRDGGLSKVVENTSFAGGSGLLTTADDLVKWLLNFDHCEAGSPVAFELLHERGALNGGQPFDYGLGLELQEYRGLQWVGHGGVWMGYKNYMVRIPEEKLGVIILGNIDALDPKPMAQKLVDALLFGETIVPFTNRPARRETTDDGDFARCRGLYQLETGEILKLYYDAQRPMALLPEGAKMELAPVSPVELVHVPLDIGVVFSAENTLRLRRNDQTTSGHKIDPPDLEEDRIAALVGGYYSDELDVTVRIERGGERLTIRRRWDRDLVLLHIYGDWFLAPLFESVHFVRDERGAVVGFTATRRRVRNLRFKKLSI